MMLRKQFNEPTRVPEKLPKRIEYKDRYAKNKNTTLLFFNDGIEPNRKALPQEKKPEFVENASPEVEDDLVVVAKEEAVEEAVEEAKPAPQTWFGAMSAWLPW